MSRPCAQSHDLSHSSESAAEPTEPQAPYKLFIVGEASLDNKASGSCLGAVFGGGKRRVNGLDGGTVLPSAPP